MREAIDDERVMRQFLLNELDVEERERIEEQFLTNDAFKEKLLLVEEGLIEDYLENSLNDLDRQQFRSVFFSSPELREKLTIARAISTRAKAEVTLEAPLGEAISEDPVRPDGVAEAGPPTRIRRRAVWLIAAAVAVVIVMATLSVILRQPRGETEEELARRAAIQAELAELNSGSRSGSETPPKEILSLVLVPINTRAAGPPNVLRRTGVVVLELWLLPTSLNNGNFKALIRKDGARAQFEVSDLPLADKPQGRAVRLRLPASLLDPGAYQVELNAVSNGDSVFVGEYRFQLED